MGLPSNSHVPIPDRVKPGDRIRAKDINTLSRGIRTLTERGVEPFRQIVTGTPFAGCLAWKPHFRNDGTEMTPDWKVWLDYGDVNGVAPTNWDTEFSITAGTDYWPTLTVTTSNGQITAITLSMETSPQTADSTADGAPPTTFKITLGVLYVQTACMLYDAALTATATEIYRASKGSLSFAGEEPFTRYWRWAVSES